MVEQFGFAMTPECQATSWGFTSGTTSGTSSSMRKALELSIMTAPAAVTASRISLDTEAPAENSAMSTPSKDSGVISCTVSSPGRHESAPLEGHLLASRARTRKSANLTRREIHVVQHAQKLLPHRTRRSGHSHHGVCRHFLRPSHVGSLSLLE